MTEEDIDTWIDNCFSIYMNLFNYHKFQDADKLIEEFDCSDKTIDQMIAVLSISLDFKNELKSRNNLVIRVRQALEAYPQIDRERVNRLMDGLE
jgi:hypothetical protein